MPLAALFGCPSLARPSHCAPEALRCVVGGATMAIPGGACTTLRTAHCCTHVLGSPVSLIGSELPWLTGSDPSLCPGPMPQGVSYVHHANHKKHNTHQSTSGPLPCTIEAITRSGMDTSSFRPTGPFSPNVGEEEFCEVRLNGVLRSSQRKL